MPQWQGSDRRDRLPDNWPQLRRATFKRDGFRCTWRDESTGLRCEETATDCDHVKRGDDHSPGNLTSLCAWHHQKKSSREGAAAKAANMRRINQRFRRSERHPGLV